MHTKISTLLDEAYSSRINNLNKSIELGKEALELSIKFDFKDLQAKSNSLLSLFHMINGQNELCENYANASIEIYSLLQDEKGIADAKYALSGVMYKTNNYHSGMIYLIDALNVYKKFNDYHNISRCEKTIGTIYEYFDDNVTALESYENAIKAAKIIGDTKLESNALNNLSSLHIKKGDFEKADELIEASLKMKIKADDVRGLAFAIHGKAKVQAARGNFVESEKLFCQAIEIHSKMGEKLGLCMSYQKLAKLYYVNNENELAKKTLKVALKIIDAHNISLIRFKCYDVLYKIYKKEKHVSKALHYLELFLKEKSSVLNTETLKIVDKYDILVKLKTMEREAELQIERAEIIEKNNRAEEAARVRQEFLSTMSHEIRTPLNAITTIINILSEEEIFKSNSLIEPLKFSANHLIMIVNNILDYTKLDIGKVYLDLSSHNLTEILNKIHQTYQPITDEKGIELICEFDQNLSKSYNLDDTKLIQVLSNLVNNAIKFTESGHIKIKVEIVESNQEIDTVLFEISDSGEGIESHKFNQIFESFSQIKNVRTKKNGGTGLGLAIAKNIVHLFGGTISVDSKYGSGSTFSFTIELEKCVSETLTPKTEINVDFSNKTILLAEDNMINALIAIKLLTKWGFKVDHVINGHEAVMNSYKNNYDFILMDIHMPEMDGFEATKRIRLSENSNQKKPIFGLTADISAKDNTEYKYLFTGFLLKPIEIEKLFKNLKEFA